MTAISVSGPFIRRPVATTLLALGLFLMGVVSFRQLGVAAVPNVDFPIIFVTTGLPGANPETMAASVATPLERQLGALSGVKELVSTNATGATTIFVMFDIDRNIESAARDVEAALNAAQANLPADLPKLPNYFKANPNNFPVISLALTSKVLKPAQVYDAANTILAEKLSQIPGVAQVQIGGAEAPAVRIQADQAALARMGLSLEDVRLAIERANANRPKGSLDGPAQSWLIAANDQLQKADDFRPMIVAWRNGAAIRLGDVATVSDDVTNQRLAGWFNAEDAVVVGVRKQPDANMVAVIDQVKATLPLLRQWIPPTIDINVTGDRSLLVRLAMRDVSRTFAITFALVVTVIALFLRRFWATVIPAATIPLSISATFAVMYFQGFTLDNLSLMALLVAIGFVVDDAIVMIENIVRLIESGVRPLDAAMRGARQMGFTIVSITLSLLSALAPLLFMGGIMGRFFREFSVTLATAITVSAIVSLTLTPMMCGHLLRRDRAVPKAAGGRLSRLVGRVPDLYARSLDHALARPRIMLALTLAITVASVMLYGPVQKAMMPTQDTGVIRGSTESTPDISFAAMRARQAAVVAKVLEDPAVLNLTSNTGAGGFNASGGNTGSLNINLKPLAERKLSVQQVVDRLRPKLAEVPGIDTYLVPVQDFGGGARASKSRYEFTLRGPVDLATLERWAAVVRAKFATMPELTDIASDEDSAGRELRLSIDRATASRLGVTPSAIDQMLYDALGQRQVSLWYGALDQYRVVLEVRPDARAAPDALDRLYLPGPNPIPLSLLTSRSEGLAPVVFNHDGGVPSVTVSYNTAPGVSISTALDAIDKAVATLHLPAELIPDSAGEAFDAAQAIGALPDLFLGALIGMYIVLGMLYESYIHPLTILSTLPSAGLGALLALIVTGTELSIVSFIGIILLIGIVKKNAILMVDFALSAERDLGLSPREAIVRAARLRLRPITMTTLTAVLGAVPMAIGMGAGSEMRQPLGITMIGGLLVSQAVTLYTTPVVYLWLDWFRRKRPAAAMPGLAPAE